MWIIDNQIYIVIVLYEVSDSTWLMENGYDQFASDEVINGEWIVGQKQKHNPI